MAFQRSIYPHCYVVVHSDCLFFVLLLEFVMVVKYFLFFRYQYVELKGSTVFLVVIQFIIFHSWQWMCCVAVLAALSISIIEAFSIFIFVLVIYFAIFFLISVQTLTVINVVKWC